MFNATFLIKFLRRIKIISKKEKENQVLVQLVEKFTGDWNFYEFGTKF